MKTWNMKRKRQRASLFMFHVFLRCQFFRSGADHLQHDEDDDREPEATAEQPDEERPTRSGFATHVYEMLLHNESPFPVVGPNTRRPDEVLNSKSRATADAAGTRHVRA